MGWRMKNVNIMGVHWKIYIGGELPKKGGLGSLEM